MPDDSRGRKALDDLLGQLDLAQRLVRFTELREGIGGGSERVWLSLRAVAQSPLARWSMPEARRATSCSRSRWARSQSSNGASWTVSPSSRSPR